MNDNKEIIYNSNNSISNLVIMGLMIALTFVAGSIIKIPTAQGFVHMGDSMVLASAAILGKRRGAIVAAIGMAFVDIQGGYLVWAPFTFVIKFFMAYIAGVVIEKIKSKSNIKYIVGFTSGAIFMVIGYFIAGVIIANQFSGNGNVAVYQGVVYAMEGIIPNILQGIVGVVLAIPIVSIVKKGMRKVN
jgi:Predicted membrane protein